MKEAKLFKNTYSLGNMESLYDYRQRVIDMISGYVTLRIDQLDQANYGFKEIADWIRSMAE
jgi:hypothetical protein